MPIDITIGADPEFGIINKNNRIIYPDLPGTGTLGLDGCGEVAEVRPRHSTNPLKVVSNIKAALMSGTYKKVLDKCTWKAGNMVKRCPIGGHIHFGIPNTTNYERMINCLDSFLAIPVAIIEKKEEALQRMRAGYGCLSDYRNQQWGPEYRTLGSWLVSPEIAAAVLSLAKVIMYDVVNGDLSISDEKRDRAHRIFPIRNKDNLIEFYNENVKQKIQSCTQYHKYQSSINILENMIDKRQEWPCNKDMKVTWDIKSKPLAKTSLKEIFN